MFLKDLRVSREAGEIECVYLDAEAMAGTMDTSNGYHIPLVINYPSGDACM